MRLSSAARMLGALAVVAGTNLGGFGSSGKSQKPITRCYLCGTRVSGSKCPGCKRDLSGAK